LVQKEKFEMEKKFNISDEVMRSKTITNHQSFKYKCKKSKQSAKLSSLVKKNINDNLEQAIHSTNHSYRGDGEPSELRKRVKIENIESGVPMTKKEEMSESTRSLKLKLKAIIYQNNGNGMQCCGKLDLLPNKEDIVEEYVQNMNNFLTTSDPSIKLFVMEHIAVAINMKESFLVNGVPDGTRFFSLTKGNNSF
jgi:Fic family protein